MAKLMDRFVVDSCPPHSGKDYNELLQKRLGIGTPIRQLNHLKK